MLSCQTCTQPTEKKKTEHPCDMKRKKETMYMFKRNKKTNPSLFLSHPTLPDPIYQNFGPICTVCDEKRPNVHEKEKRKEKM